jgi:hypothetical protein
MLASPALSADEPPLRLTDPGLPLQELRPLDRHVWVLSLEGKWKQPPKPGIFYHVNLIFPNGQSYSHRVLDDLLFAAGEVRCLIPEYQLARNGLARSGRFVVVVSARRPVTSATAPEVVGESFEVRWPMDRPIARWAPPTRFSPPVPIDALPLPGQRLPMPPKDKIPPAEPPPVPE